MRLEAKDLKDFAQLDLRFELAKLTHRVSVFTEGILVMQKTLLGVIQIEPRQILEEGLRRELVRQVSNALHQYLSFRSMTREEINENRTSLKRIVDLLEHRSLSIEEESIERARFDRLAHLAEKRQREVMQKFSELNGNIMQIKMLMESGLEKKRREDILSGRRLSHDMVEVSATVIGKGAFGSVHAGRYRNIRC